MDFQTDDVKENLVKLIEDGLQFVDLPKDVLCSNCGDIPLFHYIYPCSHPYCRVCYVNVFQKLGKKCKLCRTEISQKKLKAVCPNKLYGCKDEIELSGLLEHLQNCHFSKERQLPKLYNQEIDECADCNSLKTFVEKIKLDIEFQKLADEVLKITTDNQKLTTDNQKLTSDVHEVVGEVQKLISEVQTLTGDNQKLNAEVKSLLSYNKEKDIQIAQLIKQIKENGNSVDQKVNYAANEEKNTLSEQLQVVKNNVEILSTRMSTSEKWCKVAEEQLKAKLQSSKSSKVDIEMVINKLLQSQINEQLIWKIKKYSNNRKEKQLIGSDPFFSSDYEHIMTFELNFSGDYLYGNVKCLSFNNDGNQLTGFLYRATISIVDQSDRSEKRDWTRVFEPRFRTSAEEWIRREKTFYIAHFNYLERTNNRMIYLKEDTICIKVLIEPLSQLFRNYFSRKGILISTIDNYARRKRDSLQDINLYLYSDYFYSSERGYRMQSRWYWTSGSIHFQFFFLVGESDGDLPDLFSHRCTVFVVNQQDSSGKNDLLIGTKTLKATFFGKEESKLQMTDEWFHNFELENLRFEKEPLLLNDKLIFKVVVKEM